MILPIYVYGNEVLSKVAEPINENSEELQKLIDNMFDTTVQANGIGLAAPQVGQSLRLFIVDLSTFEEDFPEGAALRKVFINPEIIESTEETAPYNEGCLSIPSINEDVIRPTGITISYLNRDLEPITESFTGIWARVIQHEYDHIDGIVFTQRVSPLRKSLIRSKLASMAKGKYSADYRTR